MAALKETTESISNKEIVLSENKIQELKKHVIEEYLKKSMHSINQNEFMMPLDFTTNKLLCNEEHEVATGHRHVKVGYVKDNYSSIEEIISVLQKGESSRTILCTAHAGAGKTSYVQYLVSSWIEGSNDYLNNYDVIFALAVRKVDVTAPIMDILGTGGLGYVEKNTICTLNDMLTNQHTSSRLLFVLDDLDGVTIPQDSELFKLMTGDLYSKVKLLVMSRPETTFEHMRSTYKVIIHGTTKDGVCKYLGHRFSDKEPDDIIKACVSSKIIFHLIQTPLYVKLLTCIMNEYWAIQHSFIDFVIPNTVTKLFSSMMTVLLRAWLLRVGRGKEADKLQFEEKPIAEQSNVPDDIKKTLLCFAKMSYKLISEECYMFKESVLSDYQIDINDIESSKLFCFSQKINERKLFYKHKQYQEYLAALFIVNERFNDEPFAQIVENKITQSLCTRFQSLLMVIPFTFGLSQDFAVELLSKVNAFTCVDKSGDPPAVTFHYEAYLCHEASDDAVSAIMRDILVYAEPMEYDQRFTAPLSTVYDLCSGLNEAYRITMLDQWYDLFVYKYRDTWTVSSVYERKHDGTWGESDKIISYNNPCDNISIKRLNDCLYFMLLPCKLPWVQSLSVGALAIKDEQLIYRIFPHCKQLHIDHVDEMHGRGVGDVLQMAVNPNMTVELQ